MKTDITLRDVDNYIEYGQQTRGYKTSTLNRKLAAIGSFYDFLAFDLDNPPANPVIPKRHYLKRGEHLPRDVEDATLTQLFAVVTSPRDRAMYLLMLRCGLRLDELRNLSLSDLYLKPTSGLLPRLFVRGKGNKERVAFVSDQALNALQVWLSIRPPVSDDAVFLNRFGRRYSTTGIRRHLGRYCDRAGLWLTSHQFRHTFGRHLIEHRVPVTTVQRLLGHARLETTQLYVHINDTLVMKDYATAMDDIAGRLPLPVLVSLPLAPCPPGVQGGA